MAHYDAAKLAHSNYYNIINCNMIFSKSNIFFFTAQWILKNKQNPL